MSAPSAPGRRAFPRLPVLTADQRRGVQTYYERGLGEAEIRRVRAEYQLKNIERFYAAFAPAGPVRVRAPRRAAREDEEDGNGFPAGYYGEGLPAVRRGRGR